MSLAPGIRLGPYEILSLIGVGGMGEVYKARDTRLDRAVTVKLLRNDLADRPDRRRRFEVEARAISSLSHPHICSLFDVGEQDGRAFLVMEFLEGETLDDRLSRGPLPPTDVGRYGVHIADGLDHAHRQHIVHRDLKPSNVMLTQSGAKILDFGLARGPVPEPAGLASTLTLEERRLTREGTILGTCQYMAPEQLEGKDADARTDIFAFGALLYEMATGRKAFDGQSHASVIAAILSADPPPMRELQPVVPPALDRIVRKCLAKDPDERWQGARDLKTALEWMSEPDGKEFRVPTTSPGVKRRERIAWMLAGVLLLVSALAIGFGLRRVNRNPAAAESQPVRFVVGPPENATLFAGGGVMALSPNGDLALVATPTGGESLVWIRPLGSVTARPLAGTTGAGQPFWSPDSRFVAFMTGKKLKKIDVTSGEVQTICNADGTAGTWSRSGVILFKSNDKNRIEQVPAGGGDPIAAADMDSSRGEFHINWPQFLPDGRHFLYYVKSTQAEVTGIYLASLDGKVRRRVLADESQAIYAPPGYLVFHRGGTVFAQCFDPTDRELSGDALQLVDNVAFNAGTKRGVFAVSDTGVLAYRTAGDSVLRWFDRQGNPLSTVAPLGRHKDPAISPDGKTVAVARLDPELRTHDIWLVDGDRSERRFTFDPGEDIAPVWSSDGTRIVFASRRGPKYDLYVKSSTGQAAEELLLNSSMGASPVDWSHDGRFVVLAQPGLNTFYDLWALPLAGNRQPFLLVQTPAGDGQGKLSPDGRWLAYDSAETGTREVYVRPFPDTAAGQWKISDRGGIEPKWGRGGSELYYVAADQRLMAVSVRTTPSFEKDAPRVLFPTSVIGTNLLGRNQYDVTADGERFLINEPGSGSSNPITVVLTWTAMLGR